MDKNLQMTFLNNAGKNFAITVPSVKDDLTSQGIKTVMELILSKNIIGTTGGDLTKIMEAKIVSTTVEEFKF